MANGGSAARKTQCRHRELWLRFWAVVIGIVIGELFLALLGHAWELSKGRIGIGFLGGALAWFISEQVIGIGFLEFFLRSHDFELKHYTRNFLENHKEVAPSELAKLALNLMLADSQMDDITVRVPFRDYLLLLSAATISTQADWFATYRMPVDKWKDISNHSSEYFNAIERARFRRKLRVLIRPAEELSSIDEHSEIVIDTSKSHCQLCCIALSAAFIGINDYAIFDDKLVITATPHREESPSTVLGLTTDLYSQVPSLEQKYVVQLLRGRTNIAPFLKEKEKLIEEYKQHNSIVFLADGKRKRNNTNEVRP